MKRKEDVMLEIAIAVVGIIGGVFTAITESKNLYLVLKDRKK